MSHKHKRYVKNVSQKLIRWIRRKSRPFADAWRNAAIVLLHLDLEPAREILTSLYSPSPRGRKPYDPILMLRALVLMALLKFESIPKFATALKCHSRLAQIAGFDEDVPVAGAFYAFIDRLEDGPYHKPCQHRLKPSQSRKGRHRRNLKDEKQQRQQDRQRTLEEYDSLTEKLKEELIENHDQPRQQDRLYRLEEIFAKCALIPSAELGLLGDLQKLTICGDGSALVSSANGNGKPTCECRKQGDYKCDCDRLYSDPTADWGYDSYRDTYYFGHTYYQHTISTEGHDLPLHVDIGPASETDFTLSLKSLDRLQKMLSCHFDSVNIEHAVYDAGHDAKGIYDYLVEFDIKSVIALNSRGQVTAAASGTAQRVNGEGQPLCDASLVMRRHSHDKNRHRTYYNCPAKNPIKTDGKTEFVADVEKCPLGVLCQPDSKMGPVVYVKTDTDTRLYPEIGRKSSEYKRLMNLRSGCERSNSLKKETYKLGNRVARNSAHFLVRLYLVSMVEHASVWAKDDIESIRNDADKLALAVDRLLGDD